MSTTATQPLQPGLGPFVAQSAGLGALGFGFLVGSAGANALSVGFGVSLLVIAVVSAWFIASRHREEVARQVSREVARVEEQYRIQVARSHVAGLKQLCESVLPIWCKHIGSVDSQTSEAIGALLQRFETIRERLDSAVSASQQAAGRMRDTSAGGSACTPAPTEVRFF